MLLAARVLRDEGLSVRQAADRVGYEAEAAFSRAFKRQFGVAPATYRQGISRHDSTVALRSPHR
ncbi:MAG: helix-turn-helix domain-containing protein [Burkholderiales bacterium]